MIVSLKYINSWNEVKSSKNITGASGLVVKFNVAIVEPPVRFRACALYILVFQHFLIFQRHPHKLYHRKATTINHGWKVIGLRHGSTIQKVYWTSQGSNVCFHTYVGRYLFSCANSITFFWSQSQRDSNRSSPHAMSGIRKVEEGLVVVGER